MVDPLSTAAQLGEAVGGASAFFGLLFALISVNRWRRDRLAERRAEIAGRSYVALARTCDFLALWAEGCSQLLAGSRSTQPFAGGAGVATFRSHSEWRDSHTREAVADIHTAAASASVYLEADEVQLLLEVAPLYQELRTEAGPIGTLNGMPSDSMIERLMVRFDALAERARALKARGERLRQIARFGADGRGLGTASSSR